jgi:hypothetical protein
MIATRDRAPSHDGGSMWFIWVIGWWFYVRPGRAIRKSGEYRMGRLRVVYFHIWSSEGGSPRLCWLRTDCLTPVNKIELCTDAYGIYGDPANVVASTIAELDNTPLYFTGNIGIVWGPPMDAWRGITWKICTRVWWARLDSLIVVVKRGHSCCLHGSRVSCCQVIFPCKVTIDSNLCNTLGYGWFFFTVVIP